MLPGDAPRRLGSAAPVVIHGVGDKSILHSDGVGMAPRKCHPGELEVARTVFEMQFSPDFMSFPGAARGVDSDAMNEAVATRMDEFSEVCRRFAEEGDRTGDGKA